MVSFDVYSDFGRWGLCFFFIDWSLERGSSCLRLYSEKEVELGFEDSYRVVGICDNGFRK